MQIFSNTIVACYMSWYFDKVNCKPASYSTLADRCYPYQEGMSLKLILNFETNKSESVLQVFKLKSDELIPIQILIKQKELK